ncbi:peptidase M24, structural domain-containing protein, partial [Blyttiomyces helicus]
ELGQPSPEAHPHLLKAGEVTRGVSRSTYELRRLKLASMLPEGGVAFVAGYGLRYMTRGIFYPFHQNTDLVYLTGLLEPDSAMLIERVGASSRGYRLTMFVRPRNKNTEMWDGPSAGLEGAKRFFGADEAKPIESLPNYIDDLLDSSTNIFTDLPMAQPTANPFKSTHIRFGSGHANSTLGHDPSITSLRELVDALRLIKGTEEVALMNQAGRIAGEGFAERTKPGITEHQLYALVDFEVRNRGAECLGYVPVVAGGKNALSIHYVKNNQILRDGDMVLVDAGAEVGGYCSDITRTWPVNGKFTRGQRELYEAVLRTQKACIKV